MVFEIVHFLGPDNGKHRRNHIGSAGVATRQGLAGRRFFKRRLLANFCKRNKQTIVQSLNDGLSHPWRRSICFRDGCVTRVRNIRINGPFQWFARIESIGSSGNATPSRLQSASAIVTLPAAQVTKRTRTAWLYQQCRWKIFQLSHKIAWNVAHMCFCTAYFCFAKKVVQRLQSECTTETPVARSCMRALKVRYLAQVCISKTSRCMTPCLWFAIVGTSTDQAKSFHGKQ